MPKITIDDISYELDDLSESAKAQLQMLQVTEQEIQQLQARLMIAQTARNAYAQALRQHLPTPLEQTMAQGETLKFS